MISSPSSAISSSSFITNVGQPPTESILPKTSSGDSVEVKPPFEDDDDFYILYEGGWSSPGTLKQETIEKLSKDHPGIFDGLDDPNDLFEVKPVQYQPLAKLIHDTCDLKSILNGRIGEPCWAAKKMCYGEYKGRFYKIQRSCEADWVEVHSDDYKAMKANKLFFSQLREFLFDQSISNDNKVVKLQAIFHSIDQGKKGVSMDALCVKMDLIFGETFKQARQRAIEGGIQP